MPLPKSASAPGVQAAKTTGFPSLECFCLLHLSPIISHNLVSSLKPSNRIFIYNVLSRFLVVTDERVVPNYKICQNPGAFYFLKSQNSFSLKKKNYCYSITVVRLFSLSLHPTPAKPPSLPHLHPPPWFCPCVLYSSSCNPLSSLSPPHSPLSIVRLFLTSISLVIFCFLFFFYLLCYS